MRKGVTDAQPAAPVAPCLVGAALASAVFAGLLGSRVMTFMADDYLHLTRVYGDGSLFHDHFAHWLSRVPVWAVATYALFASHLLERAWWFVGVVFAVHASGVALVTAATLRWLPQRLRAPRGVVVVATAVACWYSNDFEILYWPTCMAYALGALFLGVAVATRSPWWRATFLALAFLDYETFVLPALALLLLDASMSSTKRPGTNSPGTNLPVASVPGAFSESDSAITAQRIRRALVMWTAVAGVMVGLRAVASMYLGAFHHGTEPTPRHVLNHVVDAAAMLFRLRHHGMHTHQLATGACLALLLAGLAQAQRQRWRGLVVLLLAAFASTALFWILAYGAMRAVYGSQLLLCASLVIAACLLWHVSRARWALAALVITLSLGFYDHHRTLWDIKAHNANVLRAQDDAWRATLQACESPCTLTYENLQADLWADWVLPESVEGAYLEWLRLKYAPQKQVVFERTQETS